MKKQIWITTILMMLFISSTSIAFAQNIVDTEKLSYDINRMMNRSEVMCENAIIKYRAETFREVEETKNSLLAEVSNYLRNKKTEITIIIVVGSFLGATISYFLTWRINNKRDERLAQVIENSVKEQVRLTVREQLIEYEIKKSMLKQPKKKKGDT